MNVHKNKTKNVCRTIKQPNYIKILLFMMMFSFEMYTTCFEHDIEFI